MRAAAFFATGPQAELAYAEVPTPAIGPRDTLVRVQACGVNHSDLDSWRGTSRWDFTLPWVLGAEFTGTVTAVGDQVTSVVVGDLVTALLQYSCETCGRCQCPLNALISQLGRMTPGAQAVVAQLMAQWQTQIAVGIRNMQAAGEVARDLDADRTAAALLAGIQGGVVMMMSTGDVTALEAALDLGIGYLRKKSGTSGRTGALSGPRRGRKRSRRRIIETRSSLPVC
jgi:D-arabinose 1-dehydrogenase-like Zn-dependent alcohol dehydrogenase